MPRDSKRVCVARIGAPHGVRGEVKLWSFTADPMALAHYGALEIEDGSRSFEIETLRPHKDFLVARLKGINDRSAVETLRNVALYVARERLPSLAEEGEFYHADLVGLAVVDRSGAALGTVVAVHNFGAGDLLEIQPAEGTSMMLPFTETAVPMVDIARGRIVAEPPDGTFDNSSGRDEKA